MERYDIQIFTEKCTGCLRCQLACSYLFFEAFNPSVSRIQVVFSGDDCSVDLTSECNGCGLCVDHCFHGAIQRSARKTDR